MPQIKTKKVQCDVTNAILNTVLTKKGENKLSLRFKISAA